MVVLPVCRRPLSGRVHLGRSRLRTLDIAGDLFWQPTRELRSATWDTAVLVPRRFQRSRRKGARLPANVVVVTRPTKWGNPHPLTLGRAEAVRRYDDDLLAGRLSVTVDDAKRELRGRDVACYCPLDEPCHADVLLRVANA